MKQIDEVLERLESDFDETSRVGEDISKVITAFRERDEEIARLQERDGNAKVELCYNDGIDPFARIDLTCVDYGVADNIYVVELPDGFTIARAALADTESQVADTSSQVSTERDEEYTCKTGA